MGPPPEEEEFDPDDPDGKRGKSPAMGGGVSVEKDEPGRYTDYKPHPDSHGNPQTAGAFRVSG